MAVEPKPEWSIYGMGSILAGKIIWDWLSRRNRPDNGERRRGMDEVILELKQIGDRMKDSIHELELKMEKSFSELQREIDRKAETKELDAKVENLRHEMLELIRRSTNGARPDSP